MFFLYWHRGIKKKKTANIWDDFYHMGLYAATYQLLDWRFLKQSEQAACTGTDALDYKCNELKHGGIFLKINSK